MWNITLRTLKDRKWSLVAYCLGSIALLWLYVATYTSSQTSAAQLQELVKSYPKALLDAIGLNDLSFSTLEVYLNAKHFSLMWPLLAIILALSRSAGQIAGEIQNGTMGLLLALPIKRTKLFMAKYLSGLITIGIFTFVSIFGVMPLAAAYSLNTHIHILWMTWALVFLFMWMVYAAGLAVSSTSREKGTVYAICGAGLLGMYALYILSLITSGLHWLGYLSPFYYFNTVRVLSNGDIGLGSYVFFVSIGLLSSLFAWWGFTKRDMQV